MKGIYIVDADMDFVHYLERLILRNLPDCKTLGHNLKGNDFLEKIKGNPDLLKNIDLLIVNPKLNDMTGLALVEKTKSYRKDINVCITLKDNIKQFFLNDLSEKGLEYVMIYPNEDEYFLDKFNEFFKSIEAEKNNLKMRQSAIHNNVSSESQSLTSTNVEDVFSFLNSNDFLNQFDLDGLSDEFFLNKDNSNNKSNESLNTSDTKTEVPSFKDEFNDSENFDFNNNNNFNSVNNELKFNPEAPKVPTEAFSFEYEEPKVPADNFSFGYEEPKNPTEDFNFGYEEPKTPTNDFNFGYEEPKAPTEDFSFGYEEPKIPTNNFSFGYEEPKTPTEDFNFGYEEPKVPTEDFSFGYEEPKVPTEDFSFGYEEPKVPTNDFNFGYEEPKAPANDFNFGYEEPKTPTNDFNFGYEEPKTPANDFSFGYEEPKVPTNDFNFGYEEPKAPANDFNFGYEEPKTPANDFNFGYNEPNHRENQNNRNSNEFNYNPIGHDNQNRETPQPNNPKDRFGFTESPIQNTPSEPKQQNNGLDMGVFGVNMNDSKPNIPKDKPLVHSGFDNSGAGFNKGNGFNNESGFNKGNGFNKGTGFNPNPQPNNPINNPQKPQQGYYDYPSLDNEPSSDYDLYDDSKPIASRENKIKGLLNTDKANNLSFNSQIGIENQQEKYTHEKGQHFNEIPTFAKQIVHFFSTKGGIGKTTACVNAAIQLAKYSKKRICVVDFDLTNANLHTHFGMLDARYDLTAISNLASEIDGHSLSRIITPYRVKDRDNVGVELDIIVGFREMVMRKRFDVEETDKILSILEEMYDIVIVDSHPVYTDESVSTILKKATKIIFITEQDLTALGGTRDFILAASKYQIPLEKIFLVLNRYKSNTSTFTKKKLESTLGKNIMAVLPFDIDASREAVNTNMPITLSKPDSELAKSYFDVAKIIDPTLEMPEEKKNFFSFLGKK